MSSRTVFNGRIRGATVYGRRAWPDCFLEFVIVALTPACVRVPLTSLKVLHSKQNTFWQPAGVAELLLGVGGQYLNAKP